MKKLALTDMTNKARVDDQAKAYMQPHVLQRTSTFMACPGFCQCGGFEKHIALSGSPIKLCRVGQDEVLLVLAGLRWDAFAPRISFLRVHG